MANYQSILEVKVYHEYYNAQKDELAPVTLRPDTATYALLKQYGILPRAKSGFIQLIADTEWFSDLATLIQAFHLRFYIFSADPIIRSITKMPDIFDVAMMNATFSQDANLDLRVNNWVNPEENNALRSTAIYDRNLIGILDIQIPGPHLNLERKTITVHFETISTYWKYYIFHEDLQKNLSISSSRNQTLLFSEQQQEQLTGKTARVFLSNNEIPMRKIHSDSFSLLNDKRILMKSLPSPSPQSISISTINESTKIISHIYIR